MIKYVLLGAISGALGSPFLGTMHGYKAGDTTWAIICSIMGMGFFGYSAICANGVCDAFNKWTHTLSFW